MRRIRGRERGRERAMESKRIETILDHLVLIIRLKESVRVKLGPRLRSGLEFDLCVRFRLGPGGLLQLIKVGCWVPLTLS